MVSYASDVKFAVLDVPEGPVVTADAAIAMAEGARNVLGSDVALSITGVAGPTTQEGQPVGTIYVGIALPGAATEAVSMMVPGDRQRIREFGCINSLNELRRRLLSL